MSNTSTPFYFSGEDTPGQQQCRRIPSLSSVRTRYVLPSGFRFLDGDNPADPLIARELVQIAVGKHALGRSTNTGRLRNRPFDQRLRMAVIKFSILRFDDALPDLRFCSMHSPEKKESTISPIAEGAILGFSASIFIAR